MIEVKFDLTTSMRSLDNLAEKLSQGFGKTVDKKNNSLIFPEDLAKGRCDFFTLANGLSLSILDCVFFEDIHFIREPAGVNDFSALSFNLTPHEGFDNNPQMQKAQSNEGWKRRIFYSTSGLGVERKIPKGASIRLVTFYMTRCWLKQEYQIDQILAHMKYAKEFMLDMPIQFHLNLDWEILAITREILSFTVPGHLSGLYYYGCVKNVLALIAQRLLIQPRSEPEHNCDDVLKVMSVVSELETLLEKPLPTLEELSGVCNMSQSKFAALFKKIYHKNHIRFFQELKMQKASQLLVQGWKICDILSTIGFVSQSHFTKVFKEVFSISPKSYRLKLLN